MKIINNTMTSKKSIESLQQCGEIQNNWHQRVVKLYPCPENPTKLYMIGIGNDITIISCEEIGLNEQQALAAWPRAIIRD